MTNNCIKVAVCGACGRMGQEVVKAVVETQGMELVTAIDISNRGKDIGEIVFGKKINVPVKIDIESAVKENKIDVLVDFTQPSIIYNNAKISLKNGVRPVIGTTGLSEEQLASLKQLSEEKGIGCLIAPNFTTGAVLMMMLAAQAAKYFDNAEIIELHHNNKKDAPSGTAIKTAQLMAQAKSDFAKDNIDEVELIKGSRGGTTDSNIHIHSVRMPGYIASQEVIFGSQGQVFTIRHDSMDRTCYMPGVIMAIKHVVKNNNFIYGLENIL